MKLHHLGGQFPSHSCEVTVPLNRSCSISNVTWAEGYVAPSRFWRRQAKIHTKQLLFHDAWNTFWSNGDWYRPHEVPIQAEMVFDAQGIFLWKLLPGSFFHLRFVLRVLAKHTDQMTANSADVVLNIWPLLKGKVRKSLLEASLGVWGQCCQKCENPPRYT